MLLAAAALSAIGLAIAGWVFYGYYRVWLRAAPAVPRCALVARLRLREPMLVSGVEPHDTTRGETVYLTPDEDLAVRCVKQVDEGASLGAHFVEAYAELDPARRAQAIARIVRDVVPKDPAADRMAMVALHVASGTLEGLPKEPAVEAASREVEQAIACRFRARGECQARPGVPAIVWTAGAPSVAGLLGVAGVGIGRAVKRWRLRRATRRAAKTATTA